MPDEPVPCAGSPCSPAASAAPGSCRACCTCSRSGTGRRPATEVTVVANTADDIWLHGLQGLPRPGHGDVHPRRRHRRRSAAGADATRPGTPRRSWRRTASSRPGSASATGTSPPTWCAPRCSRPATRCRAVTAALCERWQPGVAAAADDRRPGRDPRRDRRRRRSPSGAARCTSRSTGCGCTPRSRPARSCRSALETSTPGPGVLEAIADADLVVVPPSNPVVSVGTILGVPGIRDALAAPRRAGGRAVPHRRAAHPCAAWPTSCSPRSASRSAPRRSAEHYGARGRGGVLDGWLVDTADAGVVAARRGGRDRLPRRAADDDRPRRDGRDGRGRPRAGRGAAVSAVPVRDPVAAVACPVAASARSSPATTWPRWSPPRPLDAARRRHPRGHQQGGQQGRGPGRRTDDREEAIAAETDRVRRPARADLDRPRPGTAW